jgi:tetratricopeptide (TPR) repeat protein
MLRSALLGLVAAALLAGAALGKGSGRETLDSDPDFRDARLHIDAGRYREAIPLLTRLRDAYPTTPDIANWLAYSHRKLKDYPTSKRFYDEALAMDPAFLPALEYQGEWFLETGDIPSARRNLERLRELCGDCHEYRDLAEAFARHGH